MSKSLEEIWEKMQQELQSKKDAETAKENELFQIAEKKRREYVQRNRMYESISNSSSLTVGSGGGSITDQYISIINTIWLYPQEDLDYVVESVTGLTFSKSHNVYSFPTLNNLTDFYDQVYLRTAVTNPGLSVPPNPGYSLGVGTVTSSKRNQKILFKLDSGITVVEMRLMQQITNQSDLPVGGDSPDGTLGWGLVYCDWDLDGVQDPTSATPPGSFCDPLRFQLIS
jgi:hypothetical protein